MKGDVSMVTCATFINSLNKALNQQTTENGAIGYSTTNNKLVDFNFKIPSYRKENYNSIYSDFIEIRNYGESIENVFKYLFYIRDIRGGLGERRLFRGIVKRMLEEEKFPIPLLKVIPEYGRWDDLIFMISENPNADINKQIIEIIKDQLRKDIENYKLGKPISLLAKWLPSIYKKSSQRNLAIYISRRLGFNEKQYRQIVSQLRTHLKIVEKYMCENKWENIDYSAVPSRANIVYRNAFMNHDRKRRTEFLNDLQSGKAKINSSVNFPCDILANYHMNFWGTKKDDALEALWKSLPSFKGASDVLVVADTSASMLGKPMDVCFSLAIYFSEHLTGVLKDQVMLFSSRPHLVSLSNYKTLIDKAKALLNINDCSNTNIYKTFEFLLNVAVKNKLKQEELPKVLLIISDMEFDHGVSFDKTLFEEIEEKWNEAGYQMPKLAFWNVSSRTNTIPMYDSKTGVLLLSGYSTSLCEMVLSNQLDPYKAILEIINKPRYDLIGEIVRSSMSI